MQRPLSADVPSRGRFLSSVSLHLPRLVDPQTQQNLHEKAKGGNFNNWDATTSGKRCGGSGGGGGCVQLTEPCWLPGDPDALDLAILGKSVLNGSFKYATGQIAWIVTDG